MSTPTTPGQVAFEAFYWDTDHAWAHCEKTKDWHETAKAVILHHEASKQPQPQFKVGDRIRRIKCATSYTPLGFETTLFAGFHFRDKDGDILRLKEVSEMNWEKVEWPPPTNQITITLPLLILLTHGQLSANRI